jgi:hypothetical protein
MVLFYSVFLLLNMLATEKIIWIMQRRWESKVLDNIRVCHVLHVHGIFPICSFFILIYFLFYFLFFSFLLLALYSFSVVVFILLSDKESLTPAGNERWPSFVLF